MLRASRGDSSVDQPVGGKPAALLLVEGLKEKLVGTGAIGNRRGRTRADEQRVIKLVVDLPAAHLSLVFIGINGFRIVGGGRFGKLLKMVVDDAAKGLSCVVGIAS